VGKIATVRPGNRAMRSVQLGLGSHWLARCAAAKYRQDSSAQRTVLPFAIGGSDVAVREPDWLAALRRVCKVFAPVGACPFYLGEYLGCNPLR